MTTLKPGIDVRRAAGRFRTDLEWLESKHSFSFGGHYDPRNVAHGLLVVNNDDVVQAGTGFETHPHQDKEIVTWVLRGSFVHQDSEGHAGVVYPGLAQRMSAGTGILHSERNDPWRPAPEQAQQAERGQWGQWGQRAERAVRAERAQRGEPAHVVQMWVVPDEPGTTPGYEQSEVDDELKGEDLVPVASGMPKHGGEAAIRIGNRHAALHAARLGPGRSVTLPDAPFLHLFVARGRADLEDAGVLEEGDAARFTATGGNRVTATGSGAEILVWEMHATIR